MPKKQVYYKWSPSLGGGFAGTPEEVWGVKKYDPNQHKNEPCVFCGLYGLPDFYNLWRHKGKKYVWWAGSDIRNFIKGYWLEDGGNIFLNPDSLAEWINKYCESWVENKVEADLLKKFGIKAKICPSFLGDIEKFNPDDIKCEFYEGEIEKPLDILEFKYQKKIPNGITKFEPFNYKKLGEAIITRKSYYSSVSGNDWILYGWDKIAGIAKENPQNWYYLYGNTIKPPIKFSKNVIVRGRVSQEEMDKEIKYMTGCMRLIPFEGASEILVKAILWGQDVVSLIEYPFMEKEGKMFLLSSLKGDKIKARKWWVEHLNLYPWNQNANRNICKNKRVS